MKMSNQLILSQFVRKFKILNFSKKCHQFQFFRQRFHPEDGSTTILLFETNIRLLIENIKMHFIEEKKHDNKTADH